LDKNLITSKFQKLQQTPQFTLTQYCEKYPAIKNLYLHTNTTG